MTFIPFYYLLNVFLTLQPFIMISTTCHGLETIKRAFSFEWWIFVLQCHFCFFSPTRFSFLLSPLFSNLPTLLFRSKSLILPIAYLNQILRMTLSFNLSNDATEDSLFKSGWFHDPSHLSRHSNTPDIDHTTAAQQSLSYP